MVRSKVDLPEPDSPISTQMPPSAISSETLSSAGAIPASKTLPTWRNDTLMEAMVFFRGYSLPLMVKKAARGAPTSMVAKLPAGSLLAKPLVPMVA